MGAWAAERALAPGHSRDETYRIVKIECELVERQSVARLLPRKADALAADPAAEGNLVGN